jgi:5'-nucleotidase (lipoprotein e(P4) family)
MTSRPALAVALVLLAGCRSAAPVPTPSEPTKPAVAPSPAPSPFRAPEAIRWARDSAEHRALFLQVYRAATAHVESVAATHAPGTWAVVLDADETLIDNSLYQLERAQAGKPFDPVSWRAWTARREAVPLPGAAAFLARVHALGGKIAIVTNRSATECPDTEAVFRDRGLAYDVMLCRPDAGPSDKNPRFEAVARGTTPAGLPPLDVVAFLGDNVLDFPGQSQAIRKQGDEAFAEFGERFFVLPNAMYGSWERN